MVVTSLKPSAVKLRNQKGLAPFTSLLKGAIIPFDSCSILVGVKGRTMVCQPEDSPGYVLFQLSKRRSKVIFFTLKAIGIFNELLEF